MHMWRAWQVFGNLANIDLKSRKPVSFTLPLTALIQIWISGRWRLYAKWTYRHLSWRSRERHHGYTRGWLDILSLATNGRMTPVRVWRMAMHQGKPLDGGFEQIDYGPVQKFEEIWWADLTPGFNRIGDSACDGQRKYSWTGAIKWCRAYPAGRQLFGMENFGWVMAPHESVLNFKLRLRCTIAIFIMQTTSLKFSDSRSVNHRMIIRSSQAF